ncbi:hypothetical protein [Saccharothrix algeriensis]|uniref:Uncharacterized protein n=1 Tax=Saccharothrix algeriensis TaxID=173560 RepID=A0A8T8I2J9_9PSEU|nr:hypothetical protein [Saccharothrix algeriensis]MBM7810805.1 hypothetical protein [Saccharothrix algeriensis]QTR04841.1 hypothetical protein J7S33_08670 [Saccharothrix algeriensis]
MEYRWRYQDEQGREVDGPAERFADQTAAEDWFSAVWPSLREVGVAQVTLLRSESEVYGPMSLAPAD